MVQLPAYFTGVAGLLLCSPFLKLFTVLTLFRFGVGLRNGTVGVLVLGASFVLSVFLTDPYIQQVGGLDTVFRESSVASLDVTFRPFLVKHTDPKILEKLNSLRTQLGAASEIAPRDVQGEGRGVQVAFPTLVAAFMVSEIREAFSVGLIILIPFLVTDLIVTNLLMALGITQISAEVVSLPLKLLLFFAVDGWVLLTQKLIQGYVA
jgi:flagellar biosynthesis protein FliP